MVFAKFLKSIRATLITLFKLFLSIKVAYHKNYAFKNVYQNIDKMF